MYLFGYNIICTLWRSNHQEVDGGKVSNYLHVLFRKIKHLLDFLLLLFSLIRRTPAFGDNSYIITKCNNTAAWCDGMRKKLRTAGLTGPLCLSCLLRCAHSSVCPLDCPTYKKCWASPTTVLRNFLLANITRTCLSPTYISYYSATYNFRYVKCIVSSGYDEVRTVIRKQIR